MDGPNEHEPLRFRVPYEKLLDDLGAHYHFKNVQAQTVNKKKANAGDFKAARERSFSNMSQIAGYEVEGGLDHVRFKLACASASTDDGLPPLSSDVLRAGSFSELKEDEEPMAPEEDESPTKGRARKSGKAGDEGNGDADDDSVGKSPSEGKTPFFDRDRQVNAAQRSASSSLDALKQSLTQLQDAITKGLASMDAGEEESFKKEKEVLSARAKGLPVLFGTELEIEEYCRQFDYVLGRTAEGLAPPCRNYREIKPLGVLEKLVGSYARCTTKEEVTAISKEIGALKRPIVSLQASIKSTFEELQKAREVRKKRSGEKKRGASSTEAAPKKKKIGDLFEHVQEVPVKECASLVSVWEEGACRVMNEFMSEAAGRIQTLLLEERERL